MRLRVLTVLLAMLYVSFHSIVRAEVVRFATFNASLNRNASGELLSDAANPTAMGVDATTANRIEQMHRVAEVLQRVDADVLLVNEFDFDLSGTPTASSMPMSAGYSSQAAANFQTNFLSSSHGGGATGRVLTNPLVYGYRHTPNTNTGLHSGFDLNNNGATVATPGAAGFGDDAYGFGNFPGQFGFTVYSKFEIKSVRSFQNFLWKDMPNNLLTNDASAGANNLATFYSADEVNALRLSSKNHVDVTVEINGQEVHFLTAHPTPPVFDGAEDRNGKRNHDEIRFWNDYIAGESYIYDDLGGLGGLPDGAMFVIAGDYNADPNDGDSYAFAIRQFLDNPLINTSLTPASAGGAENPLHQNGINPSHLSPSGQDTADFADTTPGNLRADYVLPSLNLPLVSAGVFWPTSNIPDFPLVGTFGNPNLFAGFPTSDHKAVWVDVNVVPEPATLVLLVIAGACGLAPRRNRV
jgi:3-phytase/alkaline phosphatase D